MNQRGKRDTLLILAFPYWDHNVVLARFQYICNMRVIKKFAIYSSDSDKANLFPRTYTTTHIGNINCVKIGWSMRK